MVLKNTGSDQVRTDFGDEDEIRVREEKPRALEVARHIEMMRSQLDDLNRPAPLHFVSGSSSSGVSSPCFRCNSSQHQASACPFRLQQCFACSKVGHTRSACRSACQSSQSQLKNQPRSASRPCHVRSSRSQPARPQRELPHERCSRCLAASHDQASCPFKSATCYLCHRTGHTQATCYHKVSRPSHRTQYVEESAQPTEVDEVYDLFRLDCPAASPAASPVANSAASPAASLSAIPATSQHSTVAGQHCSVTSQCSFKVSPHNLAAHPPQPAAASLPQPTAAASLPQPTAAASLPQPTAAASLPQPTAAASPPRPTAAASLPQPTAAASLPQPTAAASPPQHTAATSSTAEPVFLLNKPGPKPIQVDLLINEVPLTMEVDTGATCSIVSKEVFDNMWLQDSARPPLQSSHRRLLTYMKEEVPVVGVAAVSVSYGDQLVNLPLLVVDQPGPALLGRDWLQEIRLDWQSLFRVSSDEPLHSSASSLASSLRKLEAEFPDVFGPGLGCYKPRKVSLQVDKSAPPKFFKHRPPPLALKKDIEEELDRQVKLGILLPVPTSDWAAPVVPIKKSAGGIRLCGSYDLTVNTATSLETYPLPRIEELFAVLAGGQFYTKIDLREAYLQLELEEESQEYTTINTHRGLFRVTRLAFGIKSAVAIFQREMETLLAGVPHTAVFLDDLCITGSSPAEHLANVREVLRRLSEAGLKVNVKKTTWLATEVQYLGHRISAAGIQPAEEKVRAVRDAPEPENLQQLRAYLGLLQYYSRFLPRLSVVATPLYQLEKKDAPWIWGPEQKSSFKATKVLLYSAPILCHYQPNLPLVLTTDASPDGVAAVLSHPDVSSGADRPVAYASRRLSAAEQNYSQLDREALAVIYGVTKFHQYVYGRRFTIKTDHKPLLGLLSSGRSLPQVVSPRMLRWKLTLTGYEFVLQYVPGRHIANADGLSRLPAPVCPQSTPVPADVTLMLDAVDFLVSVAQVQSATRRDPVVSAAYLYTRDGWPDECPREDLTIYFAHRHELSIENGCLLWGLRVVVPPQLRSRVLSLLHDGHPGISAMKQLARSIIWWPGIDRAIEDRVRACQLCQADRGLLPIQRRAAPQQS